MGLRVLFVVLDYFPGVAGGAEHQARLQAEELVRRGHEVTVACPNLARVRSRAIDGVRVVRLWPGPPGFRRFFYGPRLFFYLLFSIRSFDIVHVHYAGIIGKSAVLAGLLRRRKVYYKVTAAPDLDKRPVLERWLRLPPREYLGLGMAARVQAMTPSIERQLLEAGIRPSAVQLIPNGLDMAAFRPLEHPADKLAIRQRLDLPDEGFIFLFAGRFAATKGIDVLLTAWRSLPADSRPWLVLVGTYRTAQPVERMSEEPGLFIRDWTADVADYYHAADVLILPSRREGMSNAVLEAMACGLPVIVSPAGAADGLVTDGVEGIVIPPDDVEALRAAMIRVSADKALRRRLASAAHAKSRNYAIDSVVSRIEEVYEEMSGK